MNIEPGFRLRMVWTCHCDESVEIEQEFLIESILLCRKPGHPFLSETAKLVPTPAGDPHYKCGLGNVVLKTVL